MKQSPSTFERVFVDHIELWLSALGLLLIWAVPQVISPDGGDRWRVTAITAVAVGVVHGVIFWVVRRRRQKVKAEAHAHVEAENARLEERVAERTEQVKALAAEVGMAEQRERHRLSIVLHDDLQQQLFSIQMRVLMLVEEAAAARGEVDGRDVATATDIDSVNALLSKAIDTTRNLSLELSPPVLEGEGLEEALEWLALHMEHLHGLDVAFESHAAHADTDEAMRVLLFQLVRELLFNTAKHAGVDRVSLTLDEAADGVVIRVEDRGCGFDPSEVLAAHDGGTGLLRIRKRLDFVGGDLDVQSAPGQGTRVSITAPRALHLAGH